MPPTTLRDLARHGQRVTNPTNNPDDSVNAVGFVPHSPRKMALVVAEGFEAGARDRFFLSSREETRTIPTRGYASATTGDQRAIVRHDHDDGVPLVPNLDPVLTPFQDNSFPLHKSLLLPPHLPLQTGYPAPAPAPGQHHDRSVGMRKGEYICIVGVGLLSIFLCVFAVSTVKRAWRKKGAGVWELLFWRGKRWLRNKARGDARKIFDTPTNDAGTHKEVYEVPATIGRQEERTSPPASEIIRTKVIDINRARFTLPTIQESDEHVEEVDITCAFRSTLRKLSNADGDRSRPTVAPHTKKNDVLAELSLRAGMESIGKRGGGGLRNARATPDSDYSDTSLSETGFEGFSDGNSSRSGATSVAEDHSDDSEGEGEDAFAEGEEAEVVEVRKAQTKSMEVKKGVLVSWPTSNSLMEMTGKTTFGLPASLLPGGAVPSPYSLPSIPLSHSSQDGMLRAPVLDVMITCPSINSLVTLDSSTSSVSVDLNDFPNPPTPLDTRRQLACISNKTDKSPLFGEGGKQYSQWKRIETEKRSTVVQFIMMYGNV